MLSAKTTMPAFFRRRMPPASFGHLDLPPQHLVRQTFVRGLDPDVDGMTAGPGQQVDHLLGHHVGPHVAVVREADLAPVEIAELPQPARAVDEDALSETDHLQRSVCLDVQSSRTTFSGLRIRTFFQLGP